MKSLFIKIASTYCIPSPGWTTEITPKIVLFCIIKHNQYFTFTISTVFQNTEFCERPPWYRLTSRIETRRVKSKKKKTDSQEMVHSFVTLIENRTRLWQEMVSAPLSDRPNQFLSVATDERSVSIRENRFYLSNRHVVSHMVRLQRRHQNCGKVMLSVMSVSLFTGGVSMWSISLMSWTSPCRNPPLFIMKHVQLANGGYASYRKAFLLKHVNTFSYPSSKHFRLKPWLLIKTRIKKGFFLAFVNILKFLFHICLDVQIRLLVWYAK